MNQKKVSAILPVSSPPATPTHVASSFSFSTGSRIRKDNYVCRHHLFNQNRYFSSPSSSNRLAMIHKTNNPRNDMDYAWWKNAAAALLLAGWTSNYNQNRNENIMESSSLSFFPNHTSICEQSSTSSSSSPSFKTKTMRKPPQNDYNYYHPMSYYYEKIRGDDLEFWNDTHAIFGSLMKEGLIERFNLYKLVHVGNESNADGVKEEEWNANTNTNTNGSKKKKELIVSDIRIGKNLNGHKGIVHGGIIGLLFDETFGWAIACIPTTSEPESGSSERGNTDIAVVTANLSVNYRRPLPAETDVVIRVYQEKIQGRKIYFSARMESHDGSILYSEASALFIKIKKSAIS